MYETYKENKKSTIYEVFLIFANICIYLFEYSCVFEYSNFCHYREPDQNKGNLERPGQPSQKIGIQLHMSQPRACILSVCMLQQSVVSLPT